MSNETKHVVLGMNFSTASQRLRKLIMWSLVQETGKDVCFVCNEQIENVDDLSIEHKVPWQGAHDPQKAFFDLNNIAFSHLHCNGCQGNVGRKRRERCWKGHPLDDENTIWEGTQRRCKKCTRWRSKMYRRKRRKLHSSVDRAAVS